MATTHSVPSMSCKIELDSDVPHFWVENVPAVVVHAPVQLGVRGRGLLVTRKRVEGRECVHNFVREEKMANFHSLGSFNLRFHIKTTEMKIKHVRKKAL